MAENLGFGVMKNKAPAVPVSSGEISGLTEQINALSSRLRVAEERCADLRKKILFIEQNMISNQKRLVSESKMLSEELAEVKHRITTHDDTILTLIKELKLTSKKEDVEVLKRYIELWNPVKFVYAEHIDHLVKDALDRIRHEDLEKEKEKENEDEGQVLKSEEEIG